MTWNDALFLLPEIILSIGACFLLVAPVLGSGAMGKGTSAKWAMIAVLAVTFATVLACSYAVTNVTQSRGFGAMFALDPFSIFFKLLLIVVIALVTLLSDDFLRESRYSPWEYYSLLAFALTEPVEQ